MLKVTDITKTFAVGSAKVQAVQNASFEVLSQEVAAIVGRSGSGKTTLMSLLGGLEKPTSGRIDVDEQAISKLSDHELIAYRSKKIGFVFQSYNLIPNLTALENVILAMEFARVPSTERRFRARQLLEQVGLTDAKQQRKPGRLSGGEQQRVAIARALANKPKLILADEPTGNLDSHTSAVIVDLLRHIAEQENTAIVIVTHDPALAGVADKIYRLQDGKLSQER